MRSILYLSLLGLFLLLGCTTNESDQSPEIGNENKNSEDKPLFSNIDFRIENYNVDTLTNYEANAEFFDKYIKGNNAFRVNNNNPLVNSATIKYYVVDTLVNKEIKVLIILEVADTKMVGSQITALILNDNDNVKSSTLLALTEENDAWKYYWRSYIKNDTLHRLSTGMGDSDTTRTMFRLNGFRKMELIDNKP